MKLRRKSLYRDFPTVFWKGHCIPYSSLYRAFLTQKSIHIHLLQFVVTKIYCSLCRAFLTLEIQRLSFQKKSIAHYIELFSQQCL